MVFEMEKEEQKGVTLQDVLSCAVEHDKAMNRKTGGRAPILTERRIVCALDRAARYPDWWHVNRIHFYNPELSYGRIAQLLGLSRQSVSRWIRDVEIPEDDYDALPQR